MRKGKIIGLWADQMSSPKNKTKFILKVKNVYHLLEKSLKRNWFIMTFSFVLAIPFLIATIFLLSYISSLKVNYEELQNIFSITGVMLSLPLLSTYLYLVGSIGKSYQKNLIKVSMYLAMILLTIINVGAIKKGLKSIELKKNIAPDFIFSTIFIDVYIFSFLFTKVIYSIFKIAIGKLKGFASWVVKDESKGLTPSLTSVEAKLSFMNKVITGFLAIVASILGLLLTLNKIL